MPTTVIHHQATDEACVCLRSVLHLHQLHHVEVNGLVLQLDGKDSLNNDVSHLLGKVGMNLGTKAGACNAGKDILLLLWCNWNLHVIKNLKSLFLCLIKALSNDSRMKTLINIQFSLFKKLSDKKHSGCGSISSCVILSS